jgi:hypothetical protein
MSNQIPAVIIAALFLTIGIIGSEFMANQIGYTYFGFEQPKIQIQNPRSLD